MNTLYVTEREEWRGWLSENHASENEIWLVYYKKHTGKPRIPYDDAVEEAICFGWIDSTVRRIDDERYCQKYTPRKPKSRWNKVNIARAERMINAGRMTDAGLQKFSQRQEYDEVVETLDLSPDMEEALKKNKTAWTNWQGFAPSYRRMYIYYVTSAKREDTRHRRIKKVVGQAEDNKKQMM
jgi:uncharacterized protein YdeI (YjbR/CyaY-like superfamily)